jgi:hypothetical protein
MTVVVLDNFTDSDAVSLDAHTPDTRPSSNMWTERVGDWHIQSNRAALVTSLNASLATIDAGAAEGIVTIVARMNSTSTSTARLTGAVVRWQSAGYYWACGFLIGTNTLYILQFSGGAPTTRASDNTLSLSADTLYTVEVTLNGDDITATIDGGHSITYNSATGNSSTVHGITGRDTTALIDSFEVDDGGGASITGSLSATLGATTITAAAAAAVAGAVSLTLGAVTSTASGTGDVTGSLAITLGATTISAAGQVGTTHTFTDGYGGNTFTAEDVMLVSGAPDIAFCTHDVYDVSTSRVYLQRFKLPSLPSSAVCVSATLHYFKTSSVPNSAVTCTIYEITPANGDWIGGTTYGGTPQPGEPTWNNKGHPSTPWAGSPGLSTSGVDYNASPVGSFVIGANASTGDEYTCALDPALVQSWFGQASNNGILMRASGAAEYIGSADHATTGYRPKLVIEYSSAEAVGQLSITLGAVIPTATGTVAINGASATTLGGVTIGATGAAAIRGATAQTLGSISVSASGRVQVSGATSINLGSVSLLSEGFVGNVPAIGQLAVTLGAIEPDSEGAVSVRGAASITLGETTLEASATITGGPERIGSLDITLGTVIVTSMGAVGLTISVKSGAVFVVYNDKRVYCPYREKRIYV